MGFYIEHDTTGKELPARGKAEALLASPGVTEAKIPLKFQSNLVCIVENATFDAAGFCYNKREFEDFLPTFDDLRPRRWLIVEGAAGMAGLSPENLDDPYAMKFVGRSFPYKK